MRKLAKRLLLESRDFIGSNPIRCTRSEMEQCSWIGMQHCVESAEIWVRIPFVSQRVMFHSLNTRFSLMFEL